jgi:hypothetical protein
VGGVWGRGAGNLPWFQSVVVGYISKAQGLKIWGVIYPYVEVIRPTTNNILWYLQKVKRFRAWHDGGGISDLVI